jgi:hypothetical protein
MFLNNKRFYKFICYHFKHKLLFHLYIPICNFLMHLKLLNIDMLKLNYKLKRIFNKEINSLKVIARSD